jgi:hypothetical protein
MAPRRNIFPALLTLLPTSWSDPTCLPEATTWTQGGSAGSQPLLAGYAFHGMYPCIRESKMYLFLHESKIYGLLFKGRSDIQDELHGHSLSLDVQARLLHGLIHA